MLARRIGVSVGILQRSRERGRAQKAAAPGGGGGAGVDPSAVTSQMEADDPDTKRVER